jgi:glycosyltransferase involved in cell wall biosynthesis
MRRVLITSLSATGHFPRYTRWILGSEVFRNAEVVLAARSELFEHAELRDIAGSFQPYTVDLSPRQERVLSKMSSTVDQVRRQFTSWKIWQRVYDKVNREAKVDFVFMVCADDCLEAVSLTGSPFRKTPWTGITYRQRFHFAQVGVIAPMPRDSAVRGWLFRRALHNRSLVGMFTNDETLVDYASSHLEPWECEKVIQLPDPCVDHVLPPAAGARQSLGIAQDAKVVLLYGALSMRKGIRSLVEAANSPQCPANICVLMAGLQSPEVEEFLAGEASSSLQKHGRLVAINRYISDSEEAALLAATDCIWVGYHGFYMMSGILVLASRHGIPCFVSECGVSGYLMRKHQFGMTVNPDDKATVLAALQELSNDAGKLAETGRRAMSAFSRHSITECQKLIGEMIQRAGPVEQ